MAQEQQVEDCIRYSTVIDGENFYFIIGKKFVSATVPDENKRETQKLRQIVNKICKELTKALGGDEDEYY